MSKFIMSTDWHFGKSNGKFDNIILQGVNEICDYAKKHNIRYLFNLGDTLDVKATISTSTLNHIAKAFELLNETFEKVYVLVGNHDMSKKSYDSNGHNLHILNGYSNVELIDTPSIVDIFDKKTFMIPYFPNEYMKSFKFEKADYCMAHIEVQGFMLNQFVQAEDGIDSASIKDCYKEIFLGHFHKKQTKDNISYIGNLCRFFYGENDDERGWTVVDVQDETVEFIEFGHPAMFKMKITELVDQQENLKDMFKEGDNLKLVIDTHIKPSELEELKSLLTLEYGINNLVLDDQYFSFDIDELEELDESEEVSNDKEQTYMGYLLNEMTKGNTKDSDVLPPAIEYLKDKMNEYQD